MDRKVVLIGAFDTKGPEYSFLASLIEKSGCKLITVNTGVMDDARQLHVDIPATEVALAGGSDIGSLRKAADRGNAIKVLSVGAEVVVRHLFDREGFEGIIVRDGKGGTHVGQRRKGGETG